MVCKGAIVSALGFLAIADTDHVIRLASRAGGTSPTGNGFDSKEIHASLYCFYISLWPKNDSLMPRINSPQIHHHRWLFLIEHPESLDVEGGAHFER